jgi:hypothetical protein
MKLFKRAFFISKFQSFIIEFSTTFNNLKRITLSFIVSLTYIDEQLSGEFSKVDLNSF